MRFCLCVVKRKLREYENDDEVVMCCFAAQSSGSCVGCVAEPHLLCSANAHLFVVGWQCSCTRRPQWSCLYFSVHRRQRLHRVGGAKVCATCHLVMIIIDWQHINYSGRFVKHKQWERWRAKLKLVSGSKHQGRFAGFRGIAPEKNWDWMCKTLQSSEFLGRKMVRNAVHNACSANSCAFLNTLTMGAAFPRVSPRNDRWLISELLLLIDLLTD